MNLRTWLSGDGDRGGAAAGAVVITLLISGIGLIAGAILAQEEPPPVAMASETDRAPFEVPAEQGSRIGAERVAMRADHSSSRRGSVLPSSAPVRLDIPSIDVHSNLQHLGQTATGALETPAPGPHYDEAAWYRYSPTPGSLGPAVVLGHIDSASGGPSVFFRLGELQAGDLVSIDRADGSTAVFEVDAVRRYPKDDFPTQTVYGDIDHAGLRLLTCGGAFDDASGHYLDNIVVFASLVTH